MEASRSLNAEPALESRMKIRRISGVSGRRESCLHGIFFRLLLWENRQLIWVVTPSGSVPCMG